MLVSIRPDPFNPWREMENFQKSSALQDGSYGACASFVGSMRDFNLGDQVQQMNLQHYPGMTEKQLSTYAQKVIADYGLLEMLIVHRVGEINPNDPIVLVAAWSAHRAAAFDGCRDMMEHLKSKATFWKKETLRQNADRWVEQV